MPCKTSKEHVKINGFLLNIVMFVKNNESLKIIKNNESLLNIDWCYTNFYFCIDIFGGNIIKIKCLIMLTFIVVDESLICHLF